MSFDHLAPLYPAMEWLTAGSLLQRVRTAHLEALAGCRRILSVGEGHGRFAQACVTRYPEAELTCVEPSAGMRAQAIRRLGRHAERVRWLEAPLDQAPLNGPYDAIVTCFFLDCFAPTSLTRVVDQLAAVSAVTAVWLISDFALPTHSGLARLRAKVAHAVMYEFFRQTTQLEARALTPPDAMLARHGFSLHSRSAFDWGLLQADCWRR